MKIAIFAEMAGNNVSRGTKELFSLGKRLAQTCNADLAAILLAAPGQTSADELVQLGAAKVYMIEHPLLVEHQTGIYVEALKKIFEIERPDVVLFSHNETARNIVPYLAQQLQVGACMDCIDVSFDITTGECQGSHPFFGGNIIGSFATKRKPQCFTIRQACQEIASISEDTRGEVVQIKPDFGMLGFLTKIVSTIRPSSVSRLEDATVIISGGRGIGGSEGFLLLAELASVLGGVVGASRSAVDAGWIEPERQIGLTGKFVHPDIYIAVGISGAMQHMTGCFAAKKIIAINSNPEAPIFHRAHYGIVADYRKILPVIIRQVTEVLHTI